MHPALVCLINNKTVLMLVSRGGGGVGQAKAGDLTKEVGP